jgi:hypothetical protein
VSAPSPPAAGGPVWSLNPLVELHWKSWGPECLAFEAVSGETVVVDPLDAAALACFDAGPQSLTGVLAALGSEFGSPIDEGLGAQVKLAIDDFLAKGWLERVGPR